MVKRYYMQRGIKVRCDKERQWDSLLDQLIAHWSETELSVYT